MAPSRTDGGVTLHLITKRLSSCSVKSLPVVIPAIAKSLQNCNSVLSLSGQPPGRSEDAKIVSRFELQISKLLNDKTPQCQWAAVVLIKTAVEIGGQALLSKNRAWIPGLQNILPRPLPPSTKQLCIVAMTRIFDLTGSDPSLVREVTTPALPPFINACCHQIARGEAASNSLLTTIIQSFCHLLPNHPSVFRTFLPQIHKILAPLLAYSSDPQNENNTAPDPELVDAARSLFVATSACAPKAGATPNSGVAASYSTQLSTVVDEIHAVADQVFRAVKEDNGRSATNGTAPQPQSHPAQPHLSNSTLGLPDWTGIHAGCQRLRGLLELLQDFVQSATSTSVSFPIGSVFLLFSRLCSITVPLRNDGGRHSSSVKTNELISKEERDTLWSELPQIHATAIKVMETICFCFGNTAKSIHQDLIRLLVWIFSHEKQFKSVRAACYGLTGCILELSAPGLPKDSLQSISPMFEALCTDLVLTKPKNEQKDAIGAALVHAVSDKSKTQSTIDTNQFQSESDVEQAARGLLTSALGSVPFESISHSLRVRLEKTAILINDSDAILNLCLNMSTQSSYNSLLPFLARANPEDPATESLVRPRMPQVSLNSDRLEEAPNEDNDGIYNGTMSQTENTTDFQFGTPFIKLGHDRPVTENDTTLTPQDPELEAAGPIPLTNEVEMRGSSPDGIGAGSSSNEASRENWASRKRSTPDLGVQVNEPKRQRLDQAALEPVVQPEQPPPSEPGQPTAELDVLVVPNKTHSDAWNDEEDDSDNDDFVMPTLTLEQDTDEEQEEDNDDGNNIDEI